MGIRQDFDKSDYWLERAAQLGQPSAVAAIRALEGKTGLSDAKRRELAAEEKRERERLEKKGAKNDVVYSDALLKKAQSGDARAQCNLGYCYYHGNGVSLDYTQAAYWYRKAAEQGYAKAQNNLAVCYDVGNGVPQDYTQAVYWYRKAADQGNAMAQYNLGLCYEEGTGVPKDYTQAVYWYRKAAEQGDYFAQYNLGWCYEKGQGFKKDISQAVEWYRKAAKQGFTKAQDALKRLGYSW